MENFPKAVVQCVELQDKANKVMAGENWTSNNIDWVTCSLAEIGEGISWLAYKHWKKGQEPNFHQAFIEVIDSFHFMLSHAITLGFPGLALAHMAEGYRKACYRITEHFRLEQNIEKRKTMGKEAFKRLAEHCINCGSTSQEVAFVVAAHLEAAASLGFNEEQFFSVYISKNTLNLFRQDSGDREGTYPRMWDFEGELIEDNQVVEVLCKRDPKLALDSSALTAQLKSILATQNIPAKG